ncbi:hypothetical protein HanRHA438_Chr12g0537261 [Helianthus annuus]|nr:hypothetical protein HanRHA438_Chr12g0537261 [Helianthus annuus]
MISLRLHHRLCPLVATTNNEFSLATTAGENSIAHKHLEATKMLTKSKENLAKKNRELSSAVRTHSGFNQSTSRSGSGGVSHGRQVQPPVMIGINHHEHVGRFIGSDLNRGVDYSYKGESVEEDFSQLDLSLRL